MALIYNWSGPARIGLSEPHKRGCLRPHYPEVKTGMFEKSSKMSGPLNDSIRDQTIFLFLIIWKKLHLFAEFWQHFEEKRPKRAETNMDAIYWNTRLQQEQSLVEITPHAFTPSVTVFLGAGATFDWTFFDNSNRRKDLRQPSKVVIFDSDLVRRGNSNCRRLN